MSYSQEAAIGPSKGLWPLLALALKNIAITANIGACFTGMNGGLSAFAESLRDIDISAATLGISSFPESLQRYRQHARVR